jgi:hypothetical protein
MRSGGIAATEKWPQVSARRADEVNNACKKTRLLVTPSLRAQALLFTRVELQDLAHE